MDPATDEDLEGQSLTRIDVYRDDEIRGIRAYRNNVALELHGVTNGLEVQTLEFDSDECINAAFVNGNKRVDKVGFFFLNDTTRPWSRGGTGGDYNLRSLGSGCLIGFKGREYSDGINGLGFIYTSYGGLSTDGYA